MTESDPTDSPEKEKLVRKRKPPQAFLDHVGVGKKKGTLNKSTQAIKEAVLMAFDRVGGPDYLVELSKRDPRAFVTLLCRILPAEMKVEGEVQVSHLFSPDQLRRMADLQEADSIDVELVHEIKTENYSQLGSHDSGQAQGFLAEGGVHPSPGGDELGSVTPRDKNAKKECPPTQEENG